MGATNFDVSPSRKSEIVSQALRQSILHGIGITSEIVPLRFSPNNLTKICNRHRRAITVASAAPIASG